MTNQLFDLLKRIAAGEHYSKANGPLAELCQMALVTLKIDKTTKRVKEAIITQTGEAFLAVYGRRIEYARSRRAANGTSS